MPLTVQPLIVTHSNHAKKAGDPRIRSTLRAIQSDPSGTIAGLARAVNLSQSRLSHLFKVETGQSLQKLIRDCRLDKAAEMLRSTNTAIKVVSYNVGYMHPPSFVRAFRNQFACTPQEYRYRQKPLAKCS